MATQNIKTYATLIQSSLSSNTWDYDVVLNGRIASDTMHRGVAGPHFDVHRTKIEFDAYIQARCFIQ